MLKFSLLNFNSVIKEKEKTTTYTILNKKKSQFLIFFKLRHFKTKVNFFRLFCFQFFILSEGGLISLLHLNRGSCQII